MYLQQYSVIVLESMAHFEQPDVVLLAENVFFIVAHVRKITYMIDKSLTQRQYCCVISYTNYVVTQVSDNIPNRISTHRRIEV